MGIILKNQNFFIGARPHAPPPQPAPLHVGSIFTGNDTSRALQGAFEIERFFFVGSHVYDVLFYSRRKQPYPKQGVKTISKPNQTKPSLQEIVLSIQAFQNASEPPLSGDPASSRVVRASAFPPAGRGSIRREGCIYSSMWCNPWSSHTKNFKNGAYVPLCVVLRIRN